MIKLMKFEFLRKRLWFLMAFGLMFLVQLAVSYQYYQVEAGFRSYYAADLVLIYLVSLLVCFTLLFLIDLITLFRNDFFKKEGYMLFMTPHSGYKILGSKLLFALLEGIVIALVYVLVAAVNIRMVYGPNALMGISLDLEFYPLVAKISALFIVSVVEFALTVYLAFALFKSLINNTRFKGLITFFIFVGIGLLKSQFSGLVIQLTMDRSYFENAVYYSFTEFLAILNQLIHIGIGLSLVMAAFMFWATGYLIERKINL